MARRVFFSFHYQNDIFRVNQIRNVHAILPDDMKPEAPIDHADWEKIQRSGDAAVKRWIDQQLNGCGVTAVLIGEETASRKYVNYEIQKSLALKKGLVGIRIHNCKCVRGGTSRAGKNPLDQHSIEVERGLIFTYKESIPASSHFKTYDWVNDNGRQNLASWVEEAAQLAGR
jgi:hypothetical protein